MALIVEDGTGLPDAESYISVLDATAYHLKMGRKEAWALVGNEASKEAMLRRATQYLQSRYLGRWKGNPRVFTQVLDWPRTGVETRNMSFVSNAIVPEEVKAACAELALKAFSEDLMPDATQTVKREKVGPLETEYDIYGTPSSKFESIDAMLSAYFSAGGTSPLNVPRVRT